MWLKKCDNVTKTLKIVSKKCDGVTKKSVTKKGDSVIQKCD